MIKEGELIEKVLSVNRVTKVVKGGRILSIAVLVVVGDGNGMVGFAGASAKEMQDAKRKAVDAAKRRMFRIPLKEARTLHHDSEASFGASKVVMRSAPHGTGIIAGGAVRTIFECLGVKDVVSKCVGSSNSYNVLYATFKALDKINSPRLIAQSRGLKVSNILNQRNYLLNLNDKEDEIE